MDGEGHCGDPVFFIRAFFPFFFLFAVVDGEDNGYACFLVQQDVVQTRASHTFIGLLIVFFANVVSRQLVRAAQL